MKKVLTANTHSDKLRPRSMELHETAASKEKQRNKLQLNKKKS